MPFTREGYVSPDAGEICRGEGCTCTDAQLELVGCDCQDYAAYLAAHESDPALAAMELAGDRGQDYSDPEALADLELHDHLHPFGYGRDDPAQTVAEIREVKREYLAALEAGE